jgi:hypothetical protein
MNHNDKVKIIQFLRPNAEFVLRGMQLEWMDTKQSQPSEEELEAGLIEYNLKIEEEKRNAEAKRQAALDKLAALGLEPDDLKVLGL